MRFSDVIDSLAPSAGAPPSPEPASPTASSKEWTATVSEDWMQGRSIFGGLQAALAVRAMRTLAPPDFPLRVAQTTFVAPVPAGAVRVQASVLRAGKGTVHCESRIVVDGQTAALVMGVFGRGRPSKAEVVARVPPVPDSADPFQIPFTESGPTPKFVQHFTRRWVSGALPLSGVKEVPTAIMDVGIDDRGPFTDGHLLAIADFPPPLAMSMFTAPVAGSSVTWTLEVLADHLDRQPLSGWRLFADLRAGRDGYTSQSVLVCAPGGKPAAISSQTMMVFG